MNRSMGVRGQLWSPTSGTDGNFKGWKAQNARVRLVPPAAGCGGQHFGRDLARRRGGPRGAILIQAASASISQTGALISGASRPPRSGVAHGEDRQARVRIADDDCRARVATTPE